MAISSRRSSKKTCQFTARKVKYIDYKDIDTLARFVVPITYKIISSRITGTKRKYQLQLGRAIRRARFLALMPFTDHV